MKNPYLFPSILFRLAICGTLGVGCGRQNEQRTVDLTVPVTVQEVTVGTMEATVEATGTLRAVRETELLTEVDGTLRWPAADEVPFQGMQIKKGQLIARVENEEHVLNARLETRKLVLTTAQRTLKEQEVLFKRSLVAEKDVEEARRVLSEAESNLQAARIQIAKTELRSPIEIAVCS